MNALRAESSRMEDSAAQWTSAKVNGNGFGHSSAVMCVELFTLVLCCVFRR